MFKTSLFYATNRRHRGSDRWAPKGYGGHFSEDGLENLRFGRLTLSVNPTKIDKLLAAPVGNGTGDGDGLTSYLTARAKRADIKAYREKLPDTSTPETLQDNVKLGSQAFFADAAKWLRADKDVVIYIHGYNVSWHDAVGSAAALQYMLNRQHADTPTRPVQVVLFSWPSDGSMTPWSAYKADRQDAAASGCAVGRGLLKLRDYLNQVRNELTATGERLCDGRLHLVCHSMGNFVLQNALARLEQFTTSPALPRIFDSAFLCAADVRDRALEPDGGLGRLHETARSVNVYFNTGDMAMYLSDYTKGNPDRLGQSGAAYPKLLHQKVHQVDCSPAVGGLVEHSYYLTGTANDDIRCTVAGLAQDDQRRPRRQGTAAHNTWELEG
jgi:esterase/lipase superfamily enzyme